MYLDPAAGDGVLGGVEIAEVPAEELALAGSADHQLDHRFAGPDEAQAVVDPGRAQPHLGHGEAARAVEEAVAESLRRDRTTADLGGSLTTSEVGDLLAEALLK